MDRLLYGTMPVLPVDAGRSPPPSEPVGETQVLATVIERAVQRETSCGVRGLRVDVRRHEIVLSGHCCTYHTKQMAQHAAMGYWQLGTAVDQPYPRHLKARQREASLLRRFAC